MYLLNLFCMIQTLRKLKCSFFLLHHRIIKMYNVIFFYILIRPLIFLNSFLIVYRTYVCIIFLLPPNSSHTSYIIFFLNSQNFVSPLLLSVICEFLLYFLWLPPRFENTIFSMLITCYLHRFQWVNVMNKLVIFDLFPSFFQLFF